MLDEEETLEWRKKLCQTREMRFEEKELKCRHDYEMPVELSSSSEKENINST